MFSLKKKNRLGSRERNQRYMLIAYIIGSFTTTYSVIDILYDLNITFINSIELPFYDFYVQEIIPFILSPLKLVGFNYSSFYGSIVIVAGIGASIWANAEFRSNQYLILYPFQNLQDRPGYIESDIEKLSEEPITPEPPKFLSFKSFVRFIEILFLTYTGIGIVSFIGGVVVGFYSLVTFMYEVILLSIGSLVYIFQHILFPLERFGDDDYWGTKVFLSVFNYRRGIDDTLNERLTRHRLIYPGKSDLLLLIEEIFFDAAPLCAGTIGLLFLIVGVKVA